MNSQTHTRFDPCFSFPTAWSSYYDKYINVRRGGPAGVSMLLAGYCLLSYGWSYQHISKDSSGIGLIQAIAPFATGGKSLCCSP